MVAKKISVLTTFLLLLAEERRRQAGGRGKGKSEETLSFSALGNRERQEFTLGLGEGGDFLEEGKEECGDIFFLRSGFFFGARSSSTPSQSSRKKQKMTAAEDCANIFKKPTQFIAIFPGRPFGKLLQFFELRRRERGKGHDETTASTTHFAKKKTETKKKPSSYLASSFRLLTKFCAAHEQCTEEVAVAPPPPTNGGGGGGGTQNHG